MSWCDAKCFLRSVSFPKTTVTLGAIIILISEIRKQAWKGSQVQIIISEAPSADAAAFFLLCLCFGSCLWISHFIKVVKGV